MVVKRVHILVRGRVQGVFYRANTQDQGEKLGLTGWVGNTPDGAVEITAEGGEDQLKRFVEWCRRGPPPANVTDIKVNYSEPKGEFQSFNIKYY